ncbi:MAG: fibrobacter succinogenes major paralogous domain-containing protein [Flavobacteriales bacterium]|nr:fibrobacter succinogenes major paralogous domain-containing protein [Flavobacteriales bacterium]
MKKIVYCTFITFFTLVSCSKDNNDEVPVPIVTTTPTPNPSIVSNPGNGVIDVDGNVYSSIVLGNGQEWMSENLRTSKYANGDTIPNVFNSTQWQGLASGAYSWYNNDSIAYENPYGKLYNWFVVSDPRNVCPTGWHIPSDGDWKTIESYLGMDSMELDTVNTLSRGTREGGMLKETGTTHWLTPNVGATNEINFNARGGGYKDRNASFISINGGGWWWTSTEFNYDTTLAYSRAIGYGDSTIGRWIDDKGQGYSIRCIKD